MKTALLALGGGLAIAAAGFAVPAMADARYGSPNNNTNGIRTQLHVTDASMNQTRTQARDRDHQQLTTQNQTKTQDQTRDRQQLHECWD